MLFGCGWWVAMALLVHFPTTHVLYRLRSRLPNDLPTTWHDSPTLYPPLLFIPDHTRSFWTVQNNREQSETPWSSSPTSQDLPRPTPSFPDFSTTSQDISRPPRSGKIGFEVGLVWPRFYVLSCSFVSAFLKFLNPFISSKRQFDSNHVSLSK